MFDFKGLIDALRWRTRTETAEPSMATRLLAELPRTDTLRALTEIVKAVAALNRNARVGLKDRYRSVQSYDDKARPLIRELVAVYHGETEIDGIAPRQVLPSLLACWQELASAYKLCLKQHAQQPAPRFAGEAELITLRALAYYAEQARWAYLRYFEPDARIWRSLNRLYLIADSAGFAHKPQTRYPGEAAGSIHSHYLQAILLKLAEPDRRRPEDIRFIKSQLPDWLAHVRLEKVIRMREQSFAVNLDDSKPPVKLRRNMVGERYRYLDTEALAAQLALQIHPQTSASTDAAALLRQQLLEDLAYVFSRAGQQRARRSERRSKGLAVAVASGLPQISRALQRHAGEHEWQSWTLSDESANGVGAYYQTRFDDRLQVGEVLLLRLDQHCSLHVVRRLHKRRDGTVKVGAERLAPQVQLVHIDGVRGSGLGLFCPETSQTPRLLLLEARHFQAGHDYLLSAGAQRFRIHLAEALERLPGYVLCPFRVLEKQPAPARAEVHSK